MIYLPNYAISLRCVGQVLESRSIEIFELVTTKGDEFRVEYSDPDPPYTRLRRLLLSPESITILDREGEARRRQTKSEFRFDSLSQMLRAVGKYIDSKQAELRRLNSLSGVGDIELEYQTRAGEVRLETLDADRIREFAVDMYKRRSQISNPINVIARRI